MAAPLARSRAPFQSLFSACSFRNGPRWCENQGSTRLMAKRKRPERSLFDAIDNDHEPSSAGRDAAIRSSLLSGGAGGAGTTEPVALHEAAQSRYLNYALSVITAR